MLTRWSAKLLPILAQIPIIEESPTGVKVDKDIAHAHVPV